MASFSPLLSSVRTDDGSIESSPMFRKHERSLAEAMRRSRRKREGKGKYIFSPLSSFFRPSPPFFFWMTPSFSSLSPAPLPPSLTPDPKFEVPEMPETRPDSEMASETSGGPETPPADRVPAHDAGPDTRPESAGERLPSSPAPSPDEEMSSDADSEMEDDSENLPEAPENLPVEKLWEFAAVIGFLEHFSSYFEDKDFYYAPEVRS